jgi:putative two-component system response regulator
MSANKQKIKKILVIKDPIINKDQQEEFAHLCFSDSNMALNQMLKITEDLRHIYKQKKEALLATNAAHHEVLMRLAIAAEFRDEDTGAHIIRIGYMAEKLSLLLGHSEEFGFMIRLAAPMHDVGKIGIPDSILKKPGKLALDERIIMDTHAEIGHKILANSSVPLFQLAATIALTHHEKFDGSGYPNQSAGDDIAIAGRIVALIDFFDALTMNRCYRKAFSDIAAIEMVLEQKGKHFDPAIVDVFIANIDEFIALRQSINLNPIHYEQLINYSLEIFNVELSDQIKL